jgi:hypothetical protein
MIDAGPNGSSRLSLEVKITILILLRALSSVLCEFQDPGVVGLSPPLGNCGELTLNPPISI